MKRPVKVKCPTCRKAGDWFAGAYGPFCSQRCKLVDLGKWFGEEHVISQPLRAEHLEERADAPPEDRSDPSKA
ncbi:MAG TPA: DNA gyrase inhibitor YacG [Bacillota bacterium]|nr:DNA gyrase inhibitor YacG [Bacillota bacterium]